MNQVECEEPNPGGSGAARSDPDAGSPLFPITAGRFAVLLAVLVFATFPRVLLGLRTFIIRDFGMFSYPVAYFQRASFWRGELPLWNPLNHCGVPFLAQWNTLALYPPALAYLLLPLTWALPFFCLAHLFWGGLGMFLLAQRWTRHPLAAGLAGIIFAFNGLTLNFLMWPSHVATFSWLPWVLWLGQAAWREGGTRMIWAILAAAMQMLAGGPETIGFTWLMLCLLAGADWLTGRTGLGDARLPSRRLIAGRFLLVIVLVALICAAQLLPFLELLRHSQRDASYGAASHNWSMPFWGWANFLLPLFRSAPTAQGIYFQNGQYWTSSYYAGIGTVWLVLVGLRQRQDRRPFWFAIIAFVCLVLAWGDTSFLFTILRTCFPALGLVRYPVKFVILPLALAPLLAAFGLASVAGGTRRIGRVEYGLALALVLLVGALVAVDWQAPVASQVRATTWHNALGRSATVALIVAFTALWSRSSGRGRLVYGALLLGAFWLDLVTHAPDQNPSAPTSAYAANYAGTHLNWTPAPEPARSRALVTAATRERLSQSPLPDLEANYLRNRLAARADCNLLDGIPQVDGFFSSVPREAYRLTSLPFTDPARDLNHLLDFMGVTQISAPSGWTARPSASPLVTAGQQPIFADDRAVFAALCETNADLRQMVFLPLEARGAVSATAQPDARTRTIAFGNQRFRLTTEAPAASLVVIAQTWYPAWEAFVDGRPTTLWRANYAFQAVSVPAGQHQVDLVYHDRALTVGLGLSLLGLATCLLLWWRTLQTKC